MNDKIKFIHLSDIHIGANPLGIEERFEDMGQAFKQAIDFAIQEKVDFVILAGDLFHSKDLNAKTLEQVINILRPAKESGINIFVTEGNHDMKSYSYSYSWLEFLAKEQYIYLLNPIKLDNGKKTLVPFENGRGSIYIKENIAIIGLGYPGSTANKMISNITEELKEKQLELKDKVVICMLHTGIDKFLTEAMAGVKKEDIASLINYIDYLALGHIHTRYEDKGYKIYNPGSLECVKITDEPFNKGFYLVTIDKKTKEVDAKFNLVKIRNSYCLKLNLNTVTDISSASNLFEYILTTVSNELKDKDMTKKSLLQIKLTGSFDRDLEIDIDKIKSTLKENYNLLYIEILDLTELKDNINLEFEDTNSREQIDTTVIKERIKVAGYKENEVETVFNLIEKLKEYAIDTKLNLNMVEGKEIEELLYSIRGEEDEN